MKRAIGVGVVAIAVAAVVFAVTRGGESDDATARTASRTGAMPSGVITARRDLSVGTEHRYAVALQHSTKATDGAPFSLGVEGELALAVVAAASHSTTIRAELRQPHVRLQDVRSPAPRLAVPYTFTLGTDGKLIALQFPRDLDTETRVLLTALTATAQITDGGPASEWATVETDSLGPYDARYTRSSDKLHRSKVRYRPKAEQPLIISIVNSTTEIALRADGWPERLEQREALRVGLDKASVAVEGTLTLRHLGVARDVAVAAPIGLETVAIDATSVANRDADDRELLDGASLIDLLAVLGAVRDDGNTTAHTYLRLVALFRLDPEAAKAAGATVLGGKLDPRDAGAIVGALGEAGTPVSQHALVGIVESTTVANEQRIQGVASLGLTATPQAETVATLVTMSRSTDPDLSATATLALGNAANHLGPAGAAQVDDLLARLRAATDDADRVIYLRALGNTGDARVLLALEAALASTSDVVRAAASEALRLVPDARADALIVVALDDRSSIVRTAAVFAAGYRALDPVVNALAIRARIDPDVTVRRAIVELAGNRIAELPGLLRPIVLHAAEHDPDAELRTVARTYLTQA